MNALVEVLAKAGFSAKKPKGSFFLYVKAPHAVVKPDGKRIEFKSGGGSFAVADHRAAHFHRAVG